MEKLAVFGGKPVRDKKIFYGRQNVTEDDVKAVSEVLVATTLPADLKPKNWKKPWLNIVRLNMLWLFQTEQLLFTVHASLQAWAREMKL